MAGQAARFDVSELQDFLAGLAGVEMGPAMHVAAEDLVLRVDDEYETGGHGKWPPHAPSTQRRRPGGQLLKDTGAMAASTFASWGDDFAEAASGDPKIRFHASSEPRSRIPLRNPFDIPEDAYDELAEDLLNYLLSAGMRAA